MSRQEFPPKVKEQECERAQGKCRKCGIIIGDKPKHFDHILPDWLGGKPELSNCQLLCHECHKEKTAKEDVPRIAKAKRQHRKALGIKNESRPKIQSAGFQIVEKEHRGVNKSELPKLPPRGIYVDENV